MQNILPLLVVLGLGYLLGSIPFGLILTRAAGLGDVRNIGSGNIGATNVLRTGNKGLAALTLFLDGFKAFVAVLLAPLLAAMLTGGEGTAIGAEAAIARFTYVQAAPWLAGLAAVMGHIYPVWLNFAGGKGVATYIGALIALHWPLAAVFAAVWLGMALVFRISSLSALVAIAAVLVASVVLIGFNPVVLVTIAMMSAIVVYKHQANIGRLLKGEEPRIGAKR